MMDDPKNPDLPDGPWEILGANAAAGVVSLWIANEFITPEPEQFYFNLEKEHELHRHLLAKGFCDLKPFEEVVRLGKLWSVYAKLPGHLELHVRAIKKSKTVFFVSAHIDFPRASLDHLKGLNMDQKKSYEKGKEILALYLPIGPGTPPTDNLK